jgi:hypothetical protein
MLDATKLITKGRKLLEVRHAGESTFPMFTRCGKGIGLPFPLHTEGCQALELEGKMCRMTTADGGGKGPTPDGSDWFGFANQNCPPCDMAGSSGLLKGCGWLARRLVVHIELLLMQLRIAFHQDGMA